MWSNRNEVLWLIVLCGVLLILFLVWPAKANDHHEHHADFYSKWLTAEGYSCCNSKKHHPHGDCAPLDQSHFRVRDQEVQVRIGDEWVVVSPEKIRPYVAPDMGVHLCHQGKRILCLVWGGGI